MVHVKKCPCEMGRGKPSREFYIDGKPQIYCYGWTHDPDGDSSDAFECCQNCLDWAMGDQPQKDLDEYRNKKEKDYVN